MKIRHSLFGVSAGVEGRVIVLGAPFDGKAVDSAGCKLAPNVLRAASYWMCLSQGKIFSQASRQAILDNLSISDAGDLEQGISESNESYLARLTTVTHSIISSGKIPLIIGGDHLVTLGVLAGMQKRFPAFQVIHLDAHSDIQALKPESVPSNANFVSFSLPSKSITRWIQIGVRVFSRHLPPFPENVVSCKAHELALHLQPGIPVYLTIDTDGFDPSIMPAVSYPVARGLCFEDFDLVLSTIASQQCDVIGADWVEFNPSLDLPNGIASSAIVTGLIDLLQLLERVQMRQKSSAAMDSQPW